MDSLPWWAVQRDRARLKVWEAEEERIIPEPYHESMMIKAATAVIIKPAFWSLYYTYIVIYYLLKTLIYTGALLFLIGYMNFLLIASAILNVLGAIEVLIRGKIKPEYLVTGECPVCKTRLDIVGHLPKETS